MTREAAVRFLRDKSAPMIFNSSVAFSVAGMPHPRGVRTKDELCEAMKQMWRQSGYRSAREMALVVENYHRSFKGTPTRR